MNGESARRRRSCAASRSSSASRRTRSCRRSSKIFSGASTAFGAAPNTQASAVDLALPGTLPVANRGAVERAIRFGLAVGATIAPVSIFARKNYFYPDLPKGYQISQYETPVVQGGAVDFFVGEVAHRVQLTRAHLEEDAGKSLHGVGRDGAPAPGRPARLPGRLVRHRPEPRRHAAARDRHRARHALERRGGRVRARAATRSSSGSASATATCRKGAFVATPTSRCADRARRSGRGARSRT
jgi:hypothetical protein